MKSIHALFCAQVDGAVTSGPDLSVTVNGLHLPNPFVIASGPPGTNAAVMRKAFQEGWGGVIAKTVTLDSRCRGGEAISGSLGGLGCNGTAHAVDSAGDV